MDLSQTLEMSGRLVLIRHGQSESSVRRQYGCHRTCLGLSALGRRQAELLSGRLAATGELDDCAAVFTSILPRAIETAEISLDGLSGDPTMESDCDFCELHAGEADGLTREERLERFGGPESLIAHPEEPIAPGGESWSGFLSRAGTALARLVRRYPDGTTVVFTHSGVIGASLCGLAGLCPTDLFTAPPPCTSLTVWRWTDPDQPRLLTYGDAGHLRGDIRYAGTPGFD
jgi:probable phosphoglycerate mutase